MKLDGTKVVVFGGGSGVGLASAKLLVLLAVDGGLPHAQSL